MFSAFITWELADSKEHGFIIIATIMIVGFLLFRLIKTKMLAEDNAKRFYSFMDNSPTLAWIKSEDGRFIFVNKPFEYFFGKRLAECYGRTVDEIIPHTMSDAFYLRDTKVLKTDQHVEFVEKVVTHEGRISSSKEAVGWG